MSKSVMRALLFLALYLIVLLPTKSAFSAPIKIKFAHTCPEFTPIGKGATLFKNLVEDRLKGKVKFYVYPAIKFGNTKQIMDSLQYNDVQIAPIPLHMLTGLSKKFQVFELPFLFEDEGAVARFQSSPVGRTLLDVAENKGYKGLAFWHLGMKQFLANKPLLVPSDAKGLKFGISKGVMSELAAKKYKAIDASVQSMPGGEIYTALQKGTIDGLEGTWFKFIHGRLYEAKKYISVANHAYVGFLLTTNVSFWNGLPSEIRKELDIIISKVTKYVNRLAVEDSRHAIEAITRQGFAKLKVLTDEERRQWRERMKPVWDKSESEIGVEVIRAAWRSGTGGGGDPCLLGTCRCLDKSCKEECCY